MFAIFPILQLAGLLGSTWWLNNKTFESQDLKPEIGGYDAANVFTGVGAVSALFLGAFFPPLAAVGAGMFGAGLVNMNTRGHVEAAAEEWVAESLAMSEPAGYLSAPAGRDKNRRGKRIPFVPKFVQDLLAA